ncbi:MAG TPA: hypothetical protein VIQ78_10935 [Terrimesophilobacter sp.]|uniref:hypothetical protein n=1 Tax=Terrimesophilobacter sp. TaxID=2906435 RepID=UPI002F91F463
MTDEQSWQAPGGPALPPPTPPFGGYAPAPAPGQPGSQPQPGAIGQPPAAPTGWTPPPKPGLIPLRPLDLGTILGASFRVLRRNPRPTFGVALIVQGVVTIVTFLAVGLSTLAAITRLDNVSQADESTILAGTIGIAIVSGLISVFLSIVAGALLQGIIVLEVSRGTLGEKLRLRQLLGFAKGRIGALVGWAFLIAGVLLLVIGILVGAIWLMVTTMGALGVGLGVLVGFLGGLALLVVGLWIGTKLSLVPSALMLERLSLRRAIGRSWALTNQAFWRTFGIQALVWVILWIASSVVTTPFSVIAPLLALLIDPNNTGSGIPVSVGVYILQLMVTLVISAITAVIQTAASALIYLDLRMRREGLDLELTRYVEAKQSGAAGLGSPYLPPAPAGTAPTIDSPWA